MGDGLVTRAKGTRLKRHHLSGGREVEENGQAALVLSDGVRTIKGSEVRETGGRELFGRKGYRGTVKGHREDLSDEVGGGGVEIYLGGKGYSLGGAHRRIQLRRIRGLTRVGGLVGKEENHFAGQTKATFSGKKKKKRG